MAENQRGESVAGLAIVCALVVGFAGFVAAFFSFFAFNFVGAGVCLAASGLSFGLVANASLRR